MSGIPTGTRKFLTALAKHNDKEWFEAHREDYEKHYVAVGRAMVDAIGPGLEELVPGLQWEAKVNRSLGRIFRDTRFSKEKSPYKDHLDLTWWIGDHKGCELRPGLFLRLSPDQIAVGTGMWRFEKDALARFRAAVLDESAGKALEALEKRLAKGPVHIGPPDRKTVPRGFDKDHPRARWLLYDGFKALSHEPWPEEAHTDEFVDWALARFAKAWPVGEWLLTHVSA